MIDAQQAAAAAAAAAAAPSSGSTGVPTNLPNPPASTLGGQAVPARRAVPRRALRVGRGQPVRVRLLGPHQYVYGRLGVGLRTTPPRSTTRCPSAASNLEPGDLVFFDPASATSASTSAAAR